MTWFLVFSDDSFFAPAAALFCFVYFCLLSLIITWRKTEKRNWSRNLISRTELFDYHNHFCTASRIPLYLPLRWLLLTRALNKRKSKSKSKSIVANRWLTIGIADTQAHGPYKERPKQSLKPADIVYFSYFYCYTCVFSIKLQLKKYGTRQEFPQE